MKPTDTNSAQTWHARLAKFPACRILVVGDVMLDRYWFGAVDRISPEAPVPIVVVKNINERLGGAGNVACNIAALGGQCTLLSIVGDDADGHRLTDIATQPNIAPFFVVEPKGRTTLKLRVISNSQQLLRVDFEEPPCAPMLDTMLAKFAELLSDQHVVVFSDYGKGGLGRIEEMIELAVQQNVPVLVDPKSRDFSKYRGSTMLTPNLKEFERVTGAVINETDMQQKAKRLLDKHNLGNLLVTMSARGMVLFPQDGDAIRCQSRATAVYDVSGAGDTVVAVMSLAMAAGLAQSDGLELASGAAGVVVSKVGTATVDIEELISAVAQNQAWGGR